MLRVILFSVLFVCSLQSNAQHPYYKIVSSRSDFPAVDINGLHTDVDGQLILPTHTGLMRYDGSSFELLGLEEGLPVAGIGWSTQDHLGRIWLHSHSGALSYYYDGQIHVLHEVNALIDTLYDYSDFTIDLGDTIWCEYMGAKKAAKIIPNTDGTGWSDVEIFESAFRNFRSIHGAQKYVVNYTKTPRVIPGKFEVEFSCLGDTFYRELVRPVPFAVYVNEKLLYGRNFLSIDNYLYEFNKGRLVQEKYFDKRIVSVNGDGLGNLWISFKGGGIQLLKDADFDQPGDIILDEFEIRHACRDFEGGYWFTRRHHTDLIYVPDLENKSYAFGRDWPPGDLTTAVTIRDTLYLGLTDDPIYRLAPGDTLVQLYKLMPENRKGSQVWQFFTIGYDIYATMGVNGLVKLNRERNYFEKIASERCLYAYVDDTVAYISHTEGRVSKLVNDELQLIIDFEGLKARPSFEVLIKDADRLLVSSSSGVWQYKNGEAIQLGGHPFLEQRVFRFCRLSTGELVLGSMGLGVAICGERDTLVIDKSKGLKSNMINHVYEDKSGNLWVAHMSGISMISGIGSGDIKVRNFDGRQLLDYSVSGVFEFAGKVWAYGLGGIWAVSDKRTSAPYQIKEVEVNSNGQLLAGDWQLAYGTNEIEFLFHCTQFNKNVPLQFEYRLLNYDNGWRVSSANSAQYQKIPPGTYEFEVRVSSLGSISEPTSINIVVETPFWQTWWFLLSGALAFIAILLLVIGWRVNTLRKREENKRKLVESELRTLRAQINPHFTFNAMNSIQNFVSKSDPDQALLYISKFARLMRMILDHTSEELITIVRELGALQLYMDLEVMRLAGKVKYHIEIDDEIDIEYHKIPPMTLQPFVENAIWHGIMPKKDQAGTVVVRISSADGIIVCSVEDDGIGRLHSQSLKTIESKTRKSFGLKITEERLNLINEEFDQQIEMEIIDLYDAGGKAVGTKVEVKLVA